MAFTWTRDKLFERECSKGAAPIFAISCEVTARLNQKKPLERKRERGRREKGRRRKKGERGKEANALMLLAKRIHSVPSASPFYCISSHILKASTRETLSATSAA